MAEEFLYLTTTGWKSGKQHEIEIWFVEHNGRYYIVSEMRDRSHWVQNIRHNPAVHIRVMGKASPGHARVIDPAAEPDLATTISTLMNQKYDWSDGLIVELTPE
jgi:deazaflavin-dependent oxidoreductase (nitroreductase family)